ncbi:hypothetical protein [Elizabethkingia anophelis]|uniref:hypothetical protein n=1 Tax=Elizabethkingia anophelis TaxID=1117645 RepID=UPI00301A4026
MIVKYLDWIIIVNTLIFLLFPIFIFLWYMHYGEKYSIKEDEKYRLMCGTWIKINQLAKNNSPYFWYCFQQLHPQFHIKLKEVDPTLKIQEFKFCAYLYLGYTTYEIAKYSNTAIESVKDKEYVLRKRLKLSCKESLHIWLKKKSL